MLDIVINSAHAESVIQKFTLILATAIFSPKHEVVFNSFVAFFIGNATNSRVWASLNQAKISISVSCKIHNRNSRMM